MTPFQLIDTASRHQVFLEGLKTQQVEDFNTVFEKIQKATKDVLAALEIDKLSDMARGKFEKMLVDLRTQNQEILDQQIDSFLEDMPVVSKYESEFEARALKSVMNPEGRKKVETPSAKDVHAEALKRPVQATGELLEPLVRNFATNAVNTVNTSVRLGYEQGKTVAQILKGINGTALLQFKDGVTAVNKRHAATVVRTSIQHVAGTARQVTWEENRDIVVGIEWVSTLDGKTSTQCRSLDGRKFKLDEGPRPPIHPNCRSTTAPDMDPAFDFLDKGATRSSVDGPTAATDSYFDWLKRQDKDFQDEILGEERGKLLRDGGLTSRQFADLQLDKNFKPISLERMKELEPLAFQRAGLVELFDVQQSESPATLPGRPGTGTSTGKVWDVADKLKADLGRTPTRQEVLKEARALGINDSTIGVQFGKWRKAVGDSELGGSIAPPVEPVKVVAKQITELTKVVVAKPEIPVHFSVTPEETSKALKKVGELPIYPGGGKYVTSPLERGIRDEKVVDFLDTKESRTAPRTTLSVPIKDILTNQGYADRGALEAYIKNGSLKSTTSEDDLPLAIRYKGEIHLIDGNHRVIAQKLLGKSDVAIKLIDLDKKAAPDKWAEIKKTLDETVKTAPSPLLNNTVKLLNGTSNRFKDKSGNIALDGMPDGVRDKYIWNLKEYKRMTGEDYSHAKGINANASREQVHSLLEKLNAPSKLQQVHVLEGAQAAVKKEIDLGVEFINKVTNDRFKQSKVEVLVGDSGDRESYARFVKEIKLSPQSKASTVVHEMAHHIEYESDAAKQGRLETFLARRQGKEKYKSRSKTLSDELIFEDEWVARGGSNYTSRVYRDGTKLRATEVISMGTERLFNDPVEFYRKDPEHFEITVRTLMDLW